MLWWIDRHRRDFKLKTLKGDKDVSEERKLVILNETFKKEGGQEEIEGLTIMVDGIIKQVFDKIKSDREYASYNEVLRDVIFEGINGIIKNSEV